MRDLSIKVVRINGDVLVSEVDKQVKTEGPNICMTKLVRSQCVYDFIFDTDYWLIVL